MKTIQTQAQQAVAELIQIAKLQPKDILVIGCSSSEVSGNKIGTFSSLEVAESLFAGIYPVIKEHNIFLAAQCCEHLNRAIIIEREALSLYRLDEVNVVPQPKAGGSFATTAYKSLSAPVAVETIQAHAGMDIGGTLIGMHLKAVAVPVRLAITKIGDANITCARTRPKCIGGIRAIYNEDIM